MNTTEIFPWNPSFETGLAEIDAQHRQLVGLLNQLANHLAYQSDPPTLSTVFAQLTDYAVYHFQTEERLWERYLDGDKLMVQHKKVHDSFVSEVMALKNAQGEETMAQVIERIVRFLTHWLAFHILDSDKRMAKIILALQQGQTMEQAQLSVDQGMDSAQQVLIDTVLTMYENLSSRTLQLMKEIAERQKAENRLRLFASVFENTLEAICITDAEHNILSVNASFCQACHLNEAQLRGRPLHGIKSGLAISELTDRIALSLRESGHWTGEVWSRNRHDELEPEWLTLSAIKNTQEQVSHYVWVFSSVGQLIKRQRHLEHAANHDALTGLPNRLLLGDRLELAMAQAQRTHTYLGVCYLDLDGFKPINDNLGHDAGDQALKDVALRLKALMRKNDTVARLGGDEFVILFGNLNHVDDCRGLLDRVLEEIQRPISLKNHSVNISASIGVTLYPVDNVPAMTLLLHADQSLYQAKNAGKAQYRFYPSTMR